MRTHEMAERILRLEAIVERLCKAASLPLASHTPTNEIDHLEWKRLTTRGFNVLRAVRIRTWGDLEKYGFKGVRALRNAGKKTALDVATWYAACTGRELPVEADPEVWRELTHG